MERARLIKRGAQSERTLLNAPSAETQPGAHTRAMAKTAQAWVKAFQTEKRLTPQQQFAALFS